MDQQTVEELLKKHNVPFHTWGTGEAKTFNHLLKEIEEGETNLIEKEGCLLRLLSAAMIRMYCQIGPNRLRLRENRQVFKDGRQRKRDYIKASLFEKMKPREDPLEAAKRAIKEELGINENIEITPQKTIKEKPFSSPSYPGLLTEHTFYAFEAVLPPHLYKEAGYVEEQEDKTTYFMWEQFSEADSWQ